MPDITMCKGQIGEIVCPYKENCYRFTAKADEYAQSYFMELPLKNGKCNHYWGDDGESIWNKKVMDILFQIELLYIGKKLKKK